MKLQQDNIYKNKNKKQNRLIFKLLKKEKIKNLI